MGRCRVLVTEKIADGGLDRLRDAGHDVDVQLGLSPDELLDAIVGAHALIIRSATTVTAEVLAAGTDLVVVGRAGIGLDNVDVAAATARGVMVVNAPQSNILSAAEHTMALLLAQARNVPQAHAALVDGRWERSKWNGVELSDKTLGIIGLGRIGKLVAQRALAFGMRLVAYDPFVSPERARPDERRAARPRRPHRPLRLRHPPRGQDARDHRSDRRRAAGQGQARHSASSTSARGGIIDEAGAGRRDRRGPHRRRRARRVRHRADHRVAAVRLSTGRRHPAPRCQHRRGPGQGRRHHRRAGRLALAGDFVPFAVNVCGRRGVRDRASVPRAWPSGSARSSVGCPASGPDSLEIEYQGQIAELRHPHPHPVACSRASSAASATSRCPT